MSDTVKNRFSFGIGTLGRDFYYSFVTGYLLFFLTDVRNISSTTLAIIGVLFTVLRLFDAVNDPISGWIVDNTKTKMNKFKFWQLWGMLIGIIFSFFMFSILPVSNSSPWFLVIFIVSYLGFDIFFGLNDTAYWGMLPTLSNDSGTRNKDTSVARIFANIGGFIIAVLIHPITQGLSKIFNPDLPKDQSNIQGWMIFFGIASLFMILTSFITIIFVKPKVIEVENADLKIGLKDVFTTIGRNDQLLISGLCMFTLMSGYMVIVSLGNYFAKYILGDLNYYMIFAAVLGVSQLLALAIAPTLSKKLGRKKLCTLGTFLMVLGFVIYLFPLDNIIFTIIAGFIAFGGQGFLQMVMYASVQDTVEYGELKNGQKNEAITISVLSFINKASAGIAIGITSIILIISGIGDIDINEEVQTVLTSGQKMTFRIGMFGLPMILIVLGYVMYNILFKIDEKKHDEIMLQLKLKKESKTSSSDDTIL